MQFTSLLMTLMALVVMGSAAAVTSRGLIHEADFTCPKGIAGYCCKNANVDKSVPGNCRKSDKVFHKNLLFTDGKRTWEGCRKWEFSTC